MTPSPPSHGVIARPVTCPTCGWSDEDYYTKDFCPNYWHERKRPMTRDNYQTPNSQPPARPRPDLSSVEKRNAFYGSDEYKNMTTAQKCAAQDDGFLNDYD